MTDSISFETFREKFLAIQRGVMRDYGDEIGRKLCHVLHRDLRLTETTSDEAEKLADLAAQLGVERPDTDSLDFTAEHAALHDLLEQIKMEAMMTGSSPVNVVAAMFIIGRRYGLAEAAEMGFDVPNTIPEG